MALNLSDANAAELLTLAEQFRVGSYWYGRRGRQGPAYWDFWNYLGDRSETPRPLERGQPPAALGSVALQYVKLSSGAGLALEAAYQGRRVLLIPPAPGLDGRRPAGPGGAVGGVGHPRRPGRPLVPQAHYVPPATRAGDHLWRPRPVGGRPDHLAHPLPVHPAGRGERLFEAPRRSRPGSGGLEGSASVPPGKRISRPQPSPYVQNRGIIILLIAYF